MSAIGDLFVVVKLGSNELGILVDHVREMVMMPEVTGIPIDVPYARGMITLRGRAIPLIDLRKLFGIASLAEEQQELVDALTAREEDHVNWLRELEDSVKEERDFKLATDPHKCKFGLWYDNFTTDYLLLKSLLPKFDVPHKRIHGIARQVIDHGAQGQHETAMAIIERTRDGELATMIKLFGEARRIIRADNRELAWVLQVDERPFAVSVDSVASVETLVEKAGEDVSDLLEAAGNGLLKGIAQSKADDRVILLIRSERIIEHDTAVPAAG